MSPKWNAPIKFNVILETIKEKLTSTQLYSPDVCAPHRKQYPSSLRIFKKSDSPLDVFADQSDMVQKWINDVTGGSQKILNQLTKEQCEQYTLDKHLVAKVYACGNDWQCSGFADFMFGKTIVVLDGGPHFIAGMHFGYFSAEINKGNKNIVDLSTKLNMMTRATLEKEGGFYAYLKAGEAITIPPGHLIFQCNHGAMDFGEHPVDGSDGSDLLVSKLQFGIV